MGNSEIVWDQKKYVPYQPPKKIIMRATNNLNKLAYLYPLQCKDEENLMVQYNIYCLRKKSFQCHHIVNILDTFHQNSVMSCFNKPYNLSVIVQPIPWILEDQKLNILTFVQCLYLIQGCFIGFIQIEKIVSQEFTITGKMIGINEECQVKVWFNQNFISNQPQFVPHRNNNNQNFKLYTEILKIIQPYCHQSQLFQKFLKNISIYVQNRKNQSECTQLQLAYQYFCETLSSLGITKFSDQTMFPIFFNSKKFFFDSIPQISDPCYVRSQSRNTIYQQNPNQQSSNHMIQNLTIQSLRFKAKTKQNIIYDQTTIRSQTRDSILKNHNKKNKQIKSLKSWKNSLSKIQAERRKYEDNYIIKNYQKSSSKENLKFLQDYVFGDNVKQKNRNDKGRQNKLQQHAPSIVALFNEQEDSILSNKLNKQKSTQRIKFPDKQKPRKMFFHNKKVCSSHSGNPGKGQNEASKRRQIKTIGPGNNEKFIRSSNYNNRQENSGIYQGQNMIGEYSQITIQQSQCSKSHILPQPMKSKHQIKIKHAKSHKQESIISDLKNEEDSWISYKVPNAGKYTTLVGSFQYLKQKMNQNIKVCQSISSKQASFIKLKEKQNEQKSRMVDLTFNDNIVQSILNQNQIRQIKEQEEDLEQNHLHYDLQPVSLRHKGSHTDEFFSTKQSCKKYYQPGFITGLLNHKAKSIISQK